MGCAGKIYIRGPFTRTTVLGGWAPGLVGQLIAGGYDEKIVTRITDGILDAIRKAQANMAPVQIGFGQTDASDHIYNRIGFSGPTRPLDGLMRLLKLKKAYRRIGLAVYVCRACHAL